MLHGVKVSKISDSDLWDHEVVISSKGGRFHPYGLSVGSSGYIYITNDIYEEMGIYPYDPNDDHGCSCGLCYEYDCDYDYENGFVVPIYSIEINRERMIDKIFNLDIDNNVNILANYWPK